MAFFQKEKEDDVFNQRALAEAENNAKKADKHLEFETEAVTDETVRELEAKRLKYADGKKVLEERIISEEQAWKLKMWEDRQKKGSEPPSSSAYMWNAVVNKHADLMDNYPEPAFLPREESDRESAELLSEIVPVVLERNGFEGVYSDEGWYKLKHGTSAYGVFWNGAKDNGVGEVEVVNLDLLNIYWQPGIKDIQESPYLFICAAVNNDELKEQFPHLDLSLGNASQMREYQHTDTVDRSEQSMVVDCYYKKSYGERVLLHVAKYTNGQLLYASENDPKYKDSGFYDHGRFPVVFDTLYPEADTCTGYGVIAVTRDAQTYIDAMDSLLMNYAKKAVTPRWFGKKSMGINKNQYLDWSQPIVDVEGDITEEKLMQIRLDPLPGVYYNLLQRKIDELKETSGNRDVNSGGVANGVTSGAAIATLQEAGNKLSRDSIKSSYRAFSLVVDLVVELIRQFYDTERTFRIVKPNGEASFVSYSNEKIKPQEIIGSDGEVMYGDTGDALVRKPIFDISIRAQKTNPYSKLSQNETAANLYNMGIFNPDNAQPALIMLEMMDFDGKDAIIQKVSEGHSLYNMLQTVQAENMKLKSILGIGADGQPLPAPTSPSGGAVGENPVSVAQGGAERNALNDYGQALVERANRSVKDGDLGESITQG